MHTLAALARRLAGLCPTNCEKTERFQIRSMPSRIERFAALYLLEFLLCSLTAADGRGPQKPVSTMRNGSNWRRIVTELDTTERYGADWGRRASNPEAGQDLARTVGDQWSHLLTSQKPQKIRREMEATKRDEIGRAHV